MTETAQDKAAEQPVARAASVSFRTAISGSWMLAARLTSRLMDLTTMLVLARLLVPGDFGLVALAGSLVSIVEAVLELPTSQALVRLPQIARHYYDTAFTLSLIRGVVLTLSLCVFSIPFGRFYRDNRIVPLICVLALSPAARGMISPRLADFAKRLDFSREFVVEAAGKLVALLIALTWAELFRTYWAIAAGSVAFPLGAAITSYVIAPYRPRLTLSGFEAFSGFLGWTTAAQVLSAINWQSDRLLLGKITSRGTLGLFTTANDMAQIPLATVFTPILRPLLSAFTLVRDDRRRLARSYQTSSTAMLTLALPILVGEALFAEPAVKLFFGSRWIAAVPMLRWTAISLIPALFAIPFGPLVMALDRTRYFLIRNTFEVCVKLPLVVVGALRFQFYGVIFARMISESATILFCILIVRKLIGVSVVEQVLAPWRTALSVAIMAGILVPCVPQLAPLHSPVELAAGLLLLVVVAIVCYSASLLLLWYWQGRPDGLEAVVLSHLQTMFRVERRQTLSQES